MRQARTFVRLTALSLALLPAAFEGAARADIGQKTAGSSAPARAPEALRDAVTAAVQRGASDEFRFTRAAGEARAANPRQRFGVRVRGESIAIAASADAEISLRTSGVACGAARAEAPTTSAGLPAGEARTTGNRVEIEREGGLIEWYVNGPLGLEQGYTLARRPCDAGDGLRLDIAIDPAHTVAPARGEPGALSFLDAAGREQLRYSHLVAYDAAGRQLAATMTGEGHRISLAIDDQEAVYPITVDPLVWAQTAILQGGMPYQASLFGSTVAIDQDVAIVGAPYDGSGAAYVYLRSDTLGWVQSARITQEETPDGQFGISVALEGDTAVIGATNAVYVFQKQGGSIASWKQAAKIAKFGLGGAVALSGGTIFAGVPTQDLTGKRGGEVDTYAFDGQAWTQTAKLEPPDLKPGAQLGATLAVKGSVLVAGAPSNQGSLGQGLAYVFTKQGSTWTQAARLTSDAAAGDTFGSAVATDGDRVLVGAPLIANQGGTPDGAAYLFGHDASGVWSQTAKLPSPVPPGNVGPALFGTSVALTAGRILVGVPGAIEPSTMVQSGAVAECLQPEINAPWDCSRITYPGTVQNQGLFGQFVALSSASPDRAIIGSVGSDASGVPTAGLVFEYTWDPSSGLLNESAHASGYDGSQDVGDAVAIDGDTAVVGAPWGTWGAGLKDAGSVYVFHRHGSVWTEQARLFASEPRASASFGNAVSLSGDVLAIGSFLRQNGPGEAGANGAVYIFDRTGDTWAQSAMFPAPDGDNSGFFGVTVSASSSAGGRYVVAGSPKANVNGVINQGAAYVFANNGSGWTPQGKLTAADGGIGDSFGTSVSLGLDTLAIGAPQAPVGGKLQAGKVYLFRRVGAPETGLSWDYWETLTAADGAQFDGFGQAVAHTAGAVLVGAPMAGNTTGAAYIFELAASWTQTASYLGAQFGDRFGTAVALAPGVALIGAPYSTLGQTTKGSIYLTQHGVSGWDPLTHLAPSPTSAHPFAGIFGNTVAISASNQAIIVGSPQFQGANASPAYVLMPGAATGVTCTAASDCATGFCVDGVCCNDACGNGDPNDCQACSAASGGTVDGICTPLTQNKAPQQTCRPAAGDCDLAEVCLPYFRFCPPDLFQPDGTACSGNTCSAGVCGGSGGSGAGGDAGGDAGGGQSGNGQSGSAAAGGGQAGSAGSGNAGSGQAGSAAAGGGQSGNGQSGNAAAGSGQAGQGATGGAAGSGVGAAGKPGSAGGAASGHAGSTASDAGAAGAAGDAGSPPGSAEPATDGGSSGGCSVVGGSAPPSSALGLLLGVAAGLAARRRRGA
jgi:hypothetical protein